MNSALKISNGHQGIDMRIDQIMESQQHVYVKDIHGRFLECNKAQSISFGIDDYKDVIGKSDKDFLPPMEADTIITNDAVILKTGQPKLVAEVCTFDKYKKLTMISYKSPLMGRTGKIVALYGISAPIESAFAEIPDSLRLAGGLYARLPKTISKREKECLQLLTQGMTAKKIARVIDLSPRTVEFYIENMKKKFGCSNRVELVIRAMEILKIHPGE